MPPDFEEAGAEAALRPLPGLRAACEAPEVFLARGLSPARQRNEAARQCRGEYLLFLDDDSEPAPELLAVYRSAFEFDPSVAAAGGPAVFVPRNRFERVVALLLGEPLVMGRIASRYRPRGLVRPTDERELILCNLAVRRSVFEEVGGFDEGLYPNEENEFLERLKRRGYGLLYEPEAMVERPAWQDLWTFVRKGFAYGRGRAAQAGKCLSLVSAIRLGLSAALVCLIAGSLAAAARWGLRGLLPAASLFAAYLAALSLKLLLRGGLPGALLGPPLSVVLELAYAAGIVAGLARPRAADGAPPPPVDVALLPPVNVALPPPVDVALPPPVDVEKITLRKAAPP